MAETDWKCRIYLFVRAVDATAQNKQAFAQIFVDNGGLETLQNELRAFDAPVKLSVSGEAPAQAYGLNTAVKPAMRDDLKTFLDGLTNARYVVVANTDLANYRDGEFLATNFGDLPVDPTGKIVTWDQTLGFLRREFGLQVIQDEAEL